MDDRRHPFTIAKRFRGFLPVVVDVETGGFDSQADALLELAAVVIRMDDAGLVHPGQNCAYHIKPFPGANLNEAALAFNKIKPYHPFRFAITESEALESLFKIVRKAVKDTNCTRAVLVGHNPFFDLGFLNAAIARTKIKKNPFHSFSTFDTATLAGLAYGQTVLSKAVQATGAEWDEEQAHAAIYDTEKTARLFCNIVNKWKYYQDNIADVKNKIDNH